MQDQDKRKFHFWVSFAKSIVRIAAGVGLVYGAILMAGVSLIVAEILGIIEEL